MTTKTGQTIQASASNGAGSTTRARLDCSSGVEGGIVTMRITNGGTGPTVQCVGRILIAHKTTSMPAAAAEGVDWKQVYEFGGGTTANAVSRATWRFGPEVAYIEVEFTGNTGQAVTVEAYGTTYA